MLSSAESLKQSPDSATLSPGFAGEGRNMTAFQRALAAPQQLGQPFSLYPFFGTRRNVSAPNRTASLLATYAVFPSLLHYVIGPGFRFDEYPRSEFISSAFADGLTVISTHAGKKPLLMAFLTDRIFDHAEQ